MKRIVQFTKAVLTVLTVVCLLSSTSYSQKAEPNHGVQGREWKKATVNFSDIVAYDAAHPELRNQFNPREPEFDHFDIVNRMHADDHSAKSHSAKNSVHHEKNILPASPAPVITFNGETNTSGVYPPDVSGAVGPNHILTAHNQDVKISNKTGTVISTVSLNAFWASVGAQFTSDPKEVYDPYSDRFIFTTLDNFTSSAASVLIGVTQTNDPTGTWNLFSIQIDASGVVWMDFPELGFNKNWISVGGNLFTQAGQTFAGPALFVINKANVYNNINAQHTMFVGNAAFDTANDFCLTPVSTFDANLNDLFCIESYDGTTGKYKLFTVSGTPSAPILSTPTLITGSLFWDAGTSSDFGIQSGTTTKIDLDDDRITSGVYRNGHIWTSHNAFIPQGNPTRCSAHWIELDTLGTIIQNAMLDDPSNANFYTYPAIGVASNGNAVMAFTNMGTNIHPTSAYAFRVATDPINTFRDAYQYKLGGNTYQTSSPNRWGDYSYVAIDPVDDSTFWTITEYATSTANAWGTWWAKINPTCLTPYTPVAIIGPTSICASNLSSLYYSVNPVFGATNYTWTVTGTGWSNVASTTDSIFVTPGTGTGVITVTANNSCGNNSAQTLTILIPAQVPATPGPITGNINVCNGNPQTYSVILDPTVINYTWTLPSNWTGTSTTNSIHTIVNTNGGTILVNATNGCGTSTWDSLVVSMPAAPVATSPVTINCGDSTTLHATGGNTIAWYNLPTGGNPIDTGADYTTPSLTYTTTYYVENQVPGTSDYCTPFDSALGAGNINGFSHAEVFNVLSPCTLVSVLVYAQGTANRTITLYDGGGNQLNTITLNIPTGQHRITLNFPLSVGNNFALGCIGTPNLYRNSAGANYPYNDAAGYVSITGNDVPDLARYYFFYDWELLGAPCGSGRIPVVVNVTNGVLASFTDTQNGNTYSFTNTSVGASSWLWNFGDGDTSTLQNPVHTYTAIGTYTVTLLVHNGGCTDSMTEVITITTGITTLNESTSVNIYPNPVNDNLIVSIQSSILNSQFSIVLYDIIGQIVLQSSIITTIGNNQKELNLSNLNKGIYILELQSSNGKLIRKIVKE